MQNETETDHPILREAMRKILIPEVYEYFIAMLNCDRTDDHATT